MHLSIRPAQPARSGYALLVTLTFLIVILSAFASMMYWVASESKVTRRNIVYTKSEAAAESGTEVILATMMRDFDNDSLQSANTYESLAPSQTGWPVQYTFSNSVSIGSSSWKDLPSQYKGLYGLGKTCTITTTATPLSGDAVPSTVSQTIWFGAIPIFQYAIFYNMDMEINPGNTMSVDGRVHANGNIWATGNSSSDPLIFSDAVEASGKIKETRDPDDGQSQRNGNVDYLLNVNNPLANANSLTLPIGTNNDPTVVKSLLGLPPAGLAAPNSDAYTDLGQNYPFNEADLIISNAASGTNISVFYQNQNNTQAFIKISPDVTNIVTAGSIRTTNIYYSYVTNVTFYDYRERSVVQAVQVDISKLNNWLANGGSQYNTLNVSGMTSKGHNIDSIYVFNNVPLVGGSPSSNGQLPAVRLVDGAQLPSADGLSVATPQPLYVKGNYNVTTNGSDYALTLGSSTNNTVPAALMGDSISILSDNWDDSNYIKGNAFGTRKSADTTINAATLEGIVPTSNGHYSGGVENFLRLLEDWSKNTSSHNGSGVLTYNGSIVVMFPSQYATSYWPGTGSGPGVYNPPNRQWGFDVSFKSQDKLPPMTPKVRAIIRTGWIKY